MTWIEVIRNDSTVARLVKKDALMSEIISELVVEKQGLLCRIIELEAIAPRKFTLPDGKIMAWQCPLELIPELSK